jgi:hypothetical protein
MRCQQVYLFPYWKKLLLVVTLKATVTQRIKQTNEKTDVRLAHTEE